MAPAGRLRWIALAAWALLAVTTLEPAQAGTLVNFNFTNFGSVQLDLFDDLVPTTVSNFVQHYVTTGAYNNSIIDRNVPNSDIQGGAYHAADVTPISTAVAIPLQYNRANTRGTIAMSRPPDNGIQTNTATATDQWFLNTVDNSTPFGPSPANGTNPAKFGYAVFGWVVGPGMTVVDSIAALPTFGFTSPFDQLPLQNFTQDDFNNQVNPLPNVVVLNSATVVKTHASYQNPFLADDVNNSGGLSATDALTIISELLVHGSHTLNTPFAGTAYLDVDGNGRVNASDALAVIHDLLTPPQQQASPLAGGVSPMVVVPEPSTLVLGGTLALGLAAAAARARKARSKPAEMMQVQSASG